jgi:hypothetical protein
MLHLSDLGRIPSGAALEMSVESARLALGCPFLSSEEFEAAVIAERREAGAYGPTALQRRLFWACIAVVGLAFLLIPAI